MAAPVRTSGSASVKLDANGNGQCSVGPAGVDWVITTTTVSTATAVKQPIANLYLNGVSQANLVDGTYTGSGDTTDTKHLLQPGEQLYATWTGGDPGTLAFLRVGAMAYPAGQGAAAM